MISQADLKRFASLAQTKYRQKYDQFLVEGRKAVEEVFHSKYQIDTILATEAFVAKYQPPFPFYTIPSKDMNRLSQFVSPPGIIAVVNKPKVTSATLQPGLNLVLDGIADPGNLGTILRIADWYGLRQLWLSDDCVDETNPKVIAASMGSFCRVTCLRNAESVWQTATSILGADLDGTSLYKIEVPTTPYVLIMGSESHGLRPAFAKTLTQRLTIPRIGLAESLNVSVSTGIIMDRLLTQ
jgi:TrmH family RNA methyltransferase